MPYDDITERTGTSRDAREIPETVASGILQDVVETSAALQLIPTMRMAAYTHRIPVAKDFATAYWLNGASQAAKDSAFKQTTKLTWDNVYLTPDELAVLYPVPDAWMADSNIAWGEIKTRIVEAFARKIDQAIFFNSGGVPTGFSGPTGGLVGKAITEGNETVLGSTEDSYAHNDVYLDVSDAAESIADGGFNPTGIVTRRGFSWKFNNLRTSQGDSPFQRNPESGKPGSLYGMTYTEAGSFWDQSTAEALVGDFSYAVIGIRQDMSFSIHNDGVIQDPDTGDIVYNAMQQDGKILRAVMRLGFQVAVPTMHFGGTYPFHVITPVGSS